MLFRHFLLAQIVAVGRPYLMDACMCFLDPRCPRDFCDFFVWGSFPNSPGRIKRWLILLKFQGSALSPLQSLVLRLRHRCYGRLVKEIREIYHRTVETGQDIVFQWLPSYCIVKGNDQARASTQSASGSVDCVAISMSKAGAVVKLIAIAREIARVHRKCRYQPVGMLDILSAKVAGQSQDHLRLKSSANLAPAFSNSFPKSNVTNVRSCVYNK